MQYFQWLIVLKFHLHSILSSKSRNKKAPFSLSAKVPILMTTTALQNHFTSVILNSKVTISI